MSSTVRRFAGDVLWAVAPHVCLAGDGHRLGEEDLSDALGGTLTVVIPAYDEAETLPELLPRIPGTLNGLSVVALVVDDGSHDGTTEAALAAGAVVARLDGNHGGGAALRVGYAVAVRAGSAVVVTMDADGQHLPEELATVTDPVLEGRAAFAQGSRRLGSADRGTLAREVGIGAFSRLVSFLTRTQVTDCSNAYRAIRTDVLPLLDLREEQFHASEFLIEALSRGVAYEEVPVTVVKRAHGVTKKPPTLRYGFGFSRAIVRAWARSRKRHRPRADRLPAVSALR